MPRYPQNLFYVGFGKQVSKGTGVAPAIFPQYFDGDIALTPEIAYAHYTPAGGQAANLSLVQNVKHPKSFTVIGTPKVAAALCAFALGKDTVSGAADPYTHTITLAERENMPWFSCEASVGFSSGQTDPIIARFIDCRIAQLGISAEKGMPLKLAATIQACDLEKQAAETSPSYETDKPFVFFQGTYTLDSGTIANITQFSLDFNNVLDEDDITTGVTREDLPVLRREATLNFTLKFEDGTRFWNTYMKADHSAALQALKTGDFNVKFVNGIAEGTTGHRSFEIDIPSLDHVQAEVNPGTGDGTLEYSCSAVLKQATGSEFLSIIANLDETNELV